VLPDSFICSIRVIRGCRFSSFFVVVTALCRRAPAASHAPGAPRHSEAATSIRSSCFLIHASAISGACPSWSKPARRGGWATVAGDPRLQFSLLVLIRSVLLRANAC
jgi:hypothetical protein